MSAAKIINVSGKRKKAVARAVLRPGRGVVKINSRLVESYEPKLARMKIMEPLMIAGDYAGKVDISISVVGGGQFSQAEAARLTIAKALVEFSRDKNLEQEFLEYDRHMLIADVRQREDRKPNSAGKARSKVQKSYR
ncbi:30S ribosomal protein S9 [Candidatus Woesearchaeota archaeon]|nr:30S ribosomal protein S9 [Candidatus Woesearchaeota archaeon]